MCCLTYISFSFLSYHPHTPDDDSWVKDLDYTKRILTFLYIDNSYIHTLEKDHKMPIHFNKAYLQEQLLPKYTEHRQIDR